MADKKRQPKPEVWPDGINPFVTPERRKDILENRAVRDAEIKKWYKEHPDAEKG